MMSKRVLIYIWTLNWIFNNKVNNVSKFSFLVIIIIIIIIIFPYYNIFLLIFLHPLYYLSADIRVLNRSLQIPPPLYYIPPLI